MNKRSKQKNILVVTSRLPFVYGGNEVLAETIADNLKLAGYESDVWFTPQNRFGRQVSAYIINRLTDVGFTGTNGSVDGIISLRFPGFAVRHPYHVCWLNHCMREYYDLWENHRGKLSSGFAVLKENIRRKILHIADKYLLTNNVTKLFAQSKNIAGRLKSVFGIDCEVLYPPPRTDLSYVPGEYGKYILSVSRLNARKRVELFIRGIAGTGKSALNGVIVGAGEEYGSLQKLIQELNLQDRLQMVGNIGIEDLNNLYSNALAVFYAPEDEDYGNVTLEAFRFRKPVITATDSGGPTELVRHEENGFVIEPDPSVISETFAVLSEKRNMAGQLGENGYEMTKAITWEAAIPKLIINPDCGPDQLCAEV